MTEIERKSMIKVSDITNLLDCTPAFIYAAVKRGELKCFRIGKNLRFERRTVSHWINNNLKNGVIE